VDGAVRDVGTLASRPDFPVFSRGRTPRGPSSMGRGSVNETVVFGGVRVSPGDPVVGDDDGLVIVPRAEAAERLPAALAMVRAEEERGARLARNEGTLEVFAVPAAEPVHQRLSAVRIGATSRPGGRVSRKPRM
jgi:4-hydroxy-4-methyl-2-oxoglutarate aldolase